MESPPKEKVLSQSKIINTMAGSRDNSSNGAVNEFQAEQNLILSLDSTESDQRRACSLKGNIIRERAHKGEQHVSVGGWFFPTHFSPIIMFENMVHIAGCAGRCAGHHVHVISSGEQTVRREWR